MLTRKTLRFTLLTFIFSDSIHGQKLDDLTDAGPTQRDESLVQVALREFGVGTGIQCVPKWTTGPALERTRGYPT